MCKIYVVTMKIVVGFINSLVVLDSCYQTNDNIIRDDNMICNNANVSLPSGIKRYILSNYYEGGA